MRHFSHRVASRREFLRPFVFLPFLRAEALGAAQTERSQGGESQGANLSSLETLLTPNDQFYVRNHFAVPALLPSNWRLQVAGQVGLALDVSYADLLHSASRTLTATLECAGNGVGFGGVSTASWTGVPLRELLHRAGLRPGVKQIRLVGADRGTERSSRVAMSFARSIPLEKAQDPDTLLAVRMNGAPLPAEHGFPLRAVVPGWYGMDSVKWLVRIEALDHEDTGFYMTKRYVATRLLTLGSEVSPLTKVRVKSLILQPREGATLPLPPFVIRGVAWAGEGRVTKIEVSTNAGADWFAASFDASPQPYAWVTWTYQWEIKSRGSYTLMARATDDKGNTQPLARDPQRLDSYELNEYQTVHCEVTG